MFSILINIYKYEEGNSDLNPFFANVGTVLSNCLDLSTLLFF